MKYKNTRSSGKQ